MRDAIIIGFIIDMLESTLGDMNPREADEIVEKCAEVLKEYKEVLTSETL